MSKRSPMQRTVLGHQGVRRYRLRMETNAKMDGSEKKGEPMGMMSSDKRPRTE
jgi:hypothetical protein